MTCILALEVGTIATGESIGAPGTTVGEVVFNTAMFGYQEILTDPSYHRQIVVMTSAHIGNYGVNNEDAESARTRLAGFAVRQYAERSSNHRATQNLRDYLTANGIVAIANIDTRAITRQLRSQGAMRGAISTAVRDGAELVRLARSAPSMTGANLAGEVMPAGESAWTTGILRCGNDPKCGTGLQSGVSLSSSPALPSPALAGQKPARGTGFQPANQSKFNIIALDCGIKHNILRNLVEIGGQVTVVPGSAGPEAILAHKPDGILVGNGPGDPAAVQATIETLRQLVEKVPIFGICLGHQLLACAFGAKTYKLKFGHHGANHPVQNLATGKVEITSQNHGFAVDTDSLSAAGLRPTHVSLYDQSNEGFAHESLPVFAVQFHPESAPGPHDSAYLFQSFAQAMRTREVVTISAARPLYQ